MVISNENRTLLTKSEVKRTRDAGYMSTFTGVYAGIAPSASPITKMWG